MHRAIASFLLAVISLPLIVAAVCEDEHSRSPACCRRDGMSGEKTRPSDPARLEPLCHFEWETGGDLQSNSTHAASLLVLILNGLTFNEVPGDSDGIPLVL
jgi:hypothetical protein